MRRMSLTVPTLLLANQAGVTPNGLLDITGGGWENYPVLSLPTTLDGYVVAILDFGKSEGGEAVVRMAVSDGTGDPLDAAASIMVRSERRLAPIALRFTCIIEQSGPFFVELEDDDGVLGRVDCEVVVVTRTP